MNPKLKSSKMLYEESQYRNHDISKYLLQIRYAALRETINDDEIHTSAILVDQSRCDTCLQATS